MPKAQQTILEIDLKALQHNFKFIKSKLKPETKILAVVKAFAYGSDAEQVALTLQKLDVNYFAVAYTSEGINLRNAGITKPILVLHPQPVNFDILIEHYLEPNLYSFRVLKAFIKTAEKHKQTNYPIHIKFNSGLNRLGFLENQVSEIIELVKNKTSIKIQSLLSHLAASEDPNERDFTLQQIHTFKSISKTISDKLGYQPILHQSNTSGIMNYPEAHLDMVRTGIGLYGFGNAPEINKHLKPIATLKTIISQIHTLKPGESLGYNRAYIAAQNTRTATLPIGHADGIGRHYGKGKGFVYINNQKAEILGNVCMDMIMVNISNIECQEGDEVIVFGKYNTAENLAENINSISYEILTSVSQRIKRVFRR